MYIMRTTDTGTRAVTTMNAELINETMMKLGNTSTTDMTAKQRLVLPPFAGGKSRQGRGRTNAAARELAAEMRPNVKEMCVLEIRTTSKANAVAVRGNKKMMSMLTPATGAGTRPKGNRHIIRGAM